MVVCEDLRNVCLDLEASDPSLEQIQTSSLRFWGFESIEWFSPV